MKCNECEMLMTAYPLKVIDQPSLSFADDEIYHFEDGYKCQYNGIESLKIEDLQKGNCRNRSEKMTIQDNLNEWETLINELSEKEIALYEWKTIYNAKATEIEKTTDFKSIYGKNNAEVRKQHIRNELTDWYDTIKDLEFSISYITNRITYLKELIRTQRTLMEVKNDH